MCVMRVAEYSPLRPAAELGMWKCVPGRHFPFLFHSTLRLWVSTIGTKEEGDREITSSRESPPVRAKKPRKARTAFSDHQLNQLERSFERQKYLSVQDRMDLAAALNLTDTQVKTWYQNRR